MIYDELRNFLVQSSSPETVEFFDEAIELFDNYDVQDYLDIFESSLLNDTNLTDAEIVDNVKADALSILRYLLTMQGIEVVDEVLPSELSKMAGGLFLLRYYEDQDAINAIIDSEQTSEEALSELLTLTTPLEIERTLSLLDSVQEGFFDGLKERLRDIAKNVEEEVKDVQVQIKKYIAYRKHLGNAAQYGDKFFASLGSIGLPFLTYLGFLQKDNLNQSSGFDVAQMAKDMVGLTLLSEDGHDQSLLIIRKHLSSVVGDVATATKVDIAVSKLLVEFSHAQA